MTDLAAGLAVAADMFLAVQLFRSLLTHTQAPSTNSRIVNAHAPRYASPMDAPRYCYRHPDRETGLSCSECGRPICYECMTPAPVGLRCPEHSGKPQGVERVTRPAHRAVTGIGARRLNAVTMGLIALNVGGYLAAL